MQADLNSLFSGTRPLSLNALPFPPGLRVAVLAPHPDDFDAIAITLRHLHRSGQQIHLAVLTAGANGIEDGWEGLHDVERKAAVREAEQRASCRFFGLADDRLTFLRLWEGQESAASMAADRERLRAYVQAIRPQLVFLPHGNDSNRTHRRTYETFCSIALEDKLQLWACLNLDAKTLSMRSDLYAFFDEQSAAWKAELLRCHRSQQVRNLTSRGIGFDERVLNVNRTAAREAFADQAHRSETLPYAEVFELQRFG